MRTVWVLALLLVLLITWDTVSARRHKLKTSNLNHGTSRSRDISAWGPFWNEYLDGFDKLDWSRDPRRVIREVYMEDLNCNTSSAAFNLVDSLIGQFEGQEWPAGLVKGNRVQAKSRSQLLSCMPRMEVSEFWDYLKRYPILSDREMPMNQCRRQCPKTQCNSDRWRIDVSHQEEEEEKEQRGDTCKSFGRLDDKSRRKLESLLRSRGPLTLMLDNTREPWTESELSLRNVDDCTWWPGQYHSVLLVGYGFTTDGLRYLKYKESRGPEWGDRGYGYIKFRPEGDHCSHIKIDLMLEYKIIPCGAYSSRAGSRG